MPQAVITVAGIMPPAEGKKQGKIKDSSGESYNVWGDKIHNYQVGETYNVNYENNEFNNTQFKLIKSFTHVSAQAGQRRVDPRMPPPGNMPPSNKDEHIFVCGALNNALSNPNVNPMAIATTEMVAFVNLLRQTWRLTLGKVQQSQEMNDEIPF